LDIRRIGYPNYTLISPSGHLDLSKTYYIEISPSCPPNHPIPGF